MTQRLDPPTFLSFHPTMRWGPEAEAAARSEVGCVSAVEAGCGSAQNGEPGGQPSSSTEGCEPEGTAASEASVSMIVRFLLGAGRAAEPDRCFDSHW